MSIPFNLFLVENDSAVRNSLVRVLELQGYSVHAYASGQEFLEVFDPACFGCIILDVNMPKFSGLDVYAKLIELGCAIPVLFVTGNGLPDDQLLVGSHHTTEVLQKPFHVESLLEHIEKSLLLESNRYLDNVACHESQNRFVKQIH